MKCPVDFFFDAERSPISSSRSRLAAQECGKVVPMPSDLYLRFRTATVMAALLLCATGRAAVISSSIALDDPTGASSLLVSLVGPSGPGSVRLPITGNVTGLTSGEAAAGTTGLTAVATELTPSAGPGVILTAGPPAVGGTVAYPVTTNTHSNIFGTAVATTRGLIRGIPTGPGGGVINAVSIVALTPTTATTTGHAYAAATAKARTDPFVLEPLAEDTFALLDVNLLSNYPDDPTAEFSFTALGSAHVEFELQATTNIPGLPSLFDLFLALDADSSSVEVTFTSPLMSSPIQPSDFTMTSPGTYVLAPARARFQVPFTIPAGTLASDPLLGPVGMVLDVIQNTAAVAESVPEPRGITLLGLGLLMLAGRWNRQRGTPSSRNQRGKP